VVPVIEADVICRLVESAIGILARSSVLISLPSPIVFVGDLHGSMPDLCHILHVFGTPPETRYLFLGDYVDRGPASIAVICVILALLCKYPDKISLLRGNHEFAHINRAYGFLAEISREYEGDDLWNLFQDLFSWIPLAAIVHNSIFCVHGGLSPGLKDINALKNLTLPIPNYFSDPMIADLVWSDPLDQSRGFVTNTR
jgi:hypothetical protein